MSEFWEDLALDLLEKNLNGHSLNALSLKELFKERPDVLDDLDIQMDGNEVDDIDKALYGGRPQVIEIREAKPNEIYSCLCCKRTFKRGDNWRRHLQSALHQRRHRAYELAQQEAQAEAQSQQPAENEGDGISN
jgi:hypothetical protein